MPKVSICIPAYKQPDCLKRLLDSVFQQTYADYEVIITDDTPDSSVKDVVAQYTDDRIRYFKNKTPLGSPENWNEAIRNATGEYIKIMHHDDWFINEDSLLIMVKAIVENNAMFVFCQSVNRLMNHPASLNNPSPEKVKKYRKNLLLMFLENIVGTPSTTLFVKQGIDFDKKIKWFVDIEFYIRYICQYKNLWYVQKPLICIGETESNVSKECVNKKAVIYGEFMYLYSKFSVNNMFSKQELLCLFRKFVKTNGITEKEFIKYLGKKPSYIQLLIIFLCEAEKIIQESVLKIRNFIKFVHKKLHKTITNPTNDSSTVLIGEGTEVVGCVFGRWVKVGKDNYLYNVEIGNYTYTSIRTSIMNAKIGKFCSIAQNVGIGLGKHPVYGYVSSSPVFYSERKQCGISLVDENYYEEMGFVEIGNDVWIGANAVIADDVKIGDGAVIGANSFVNKNVPPYAIVGGIPAKIIRYRFSDTEIQKLLNFQWWNKSENWLKENVEKLRDIKSFIEFIDGNN